MAADRSSSRYQGLLIPDPRITVDAITHEGAGNTDSDYGQCGPRPGVPVPTEDSDMLLRAAGDMSARARLEIYTQRAGHAGRDGAGFLWRDNSDGSDPAYNGWDPYSIVTGYETLIESETGSDADEYPAIIRLANGRLLCAAGQPAATGANQTFHIYDPTDGSWTVQTRTLDDYAVQTGVALVQLPSGRVMWFGRAANTAQINVYYSDDEMASWSLASPRALNTACGNEILKIAAAYSAGEVGLWVLWSDGGTYNLSQYASDDLGLRFTQVIEDWNSEVVSTTPTAPQVIAAHGGGFLLCLVALAVNTITHAYRVASAFSASVPDMVNVSHRADAHPMTTDAPLALWRDESGAVFVMCHSDGTSSSPDAECSIFVSYDDGRTWANYTAAEGIDLLTTDSAPVFKRYAVAATSGRAIMITRWDSTASHDDQSVAALHLGGYGSHTAPLSDIATEFTPADAVGYAGETGGSGEGFFYIPIERPTSAGWALTGAAPTITEQARAGSIPTEAIVLETDSAAGSTNLKQTLVATDQVFATFAVTPDKPGGAIDADRIVVKVRCSPSSGVSYEARIRFADSGWSVYDATSPSLLGSVVADVSTGAALMYHRVAITVPEGGTPKVQTWHARWAPVLSWTEGPGGTLTDNAVAGASAIEFGSFAGAQSDVASWYLFGACGWGDRWSPTHNDGIGVSWSLPDDLHPRNMPPLAQPALLDGSTKISAIDGPTLRGETWTIETDYCSPLDLAIATPSPRVGWESDNEDAIEIVWDLSGQSASSFLNSSIGCALLGCNFRTAVLERWDGGAWQTLISLDAAEGFDSLKFTRAGDVVTVNTASGNTADRYLHFDDARGATWEDVTGSRRRLISTQTEGAWTDSTTKRPRLLLRDVDGTEAASGDCRIWFPDMLGIAHEVTVTPRYIRLRIPASQGTVSGTYKVGQILIGSLLIFGHQPSRGFSTTTAAGVDVVSFPDGSSRANRTGPPLRSLSLSWGDGIDASGVQAASAVPDYVAGTTGGLPVASRSDIARTLEGAMREAASPDMPVLYIAKIPTNSATPDTINNPRQFLYGRASGEYRREHLLGDETVSEVDRIASITITEVI